MDDDNQERNYHIARFVTWLRRQVEVYHQDRGICTTITLKHIQSDGKSMSHVESEVLPTYTGPTDVPNPTELKVVAETMADAAINDASGMGRGLQRYTLLAYFSENPNIVTRFPFRIKGGGDTYSEDDAVGIVEDSETPDARGITAQHMRHTEAMMKHTVVMSAKVMDLIAGQNQMLADQNSTLISSRLKSIEIHEQLMDRSHQRKIEDKAADAKIKMWEEVGEKLKVLLPHAVNKLAGKKILPAEYSTEELEFVSLLQSMTPEQVDGLRTILKPEQTAVLWSVVEKVMKKHGDVDEQKAIMEAEKKQPMPKAGAKPKRKLLTGGALK